MFHGPDKYEYLLLEKKTGVQFVQVIKKKNSKSGTKSTTRD
jgi:hypothetical protein